MAGWHHWLDGHEFEWTLGVGDGQGGLACCDSWGHKESDMTERLNWTELNGVEHIFLSLLVIWVISFEEYYFASFAYVFLGCRLFIFTIVKSIGMFVILYSSCLSDTCMHMHSVHFNHILLFATLWTVACQASVSMGILQARILVWVVMPSSRGSSQARDWTHVSCISCISGRFFTHWATWEALIRYT